MSDAVAGLAGRLLAYTNTDSVWPTAEATRAATQTGLVIRGRVCTGDLRRLRASGYTETVVLDAGLWPHTAASVATPMSRSAPVGLFCPTLDEALAPFVTNGADVALTPSLFVRDGDWAALAAVLRVGREATRPDVMTLVATDAAMLGPQRRPRFVQILDADRGGRPLAFVFAAARNPLGMSERIGGLRALLRAFPGSLILGMDVLAGTDVIIHGGAAAIGVISSMRRPTRPADPSRGPLARVGYPGCSCRGCGRPVARRSTPTGTPTPPPLPARTAAGGT